MTITIDLAKKHEIQSVIDFFEKHLDNNNDGIYSKEFLCPYGTTGAIAKQEIVIAKNDNEIIGALRFYKQKKENIVSLYQFVIAENRRGKGLIKDMLSFTGCSIIHSRCFGNAKFNDYYNKTGRTLLKEDKLGKKRQLELKNK